MPIMKNLMANGVATPVQPTAPAVVPVQHVAPASLPAVATPNGGNLPAFLQRLPAAAAADEIPGSGGSFVYNASNRSPKWPQQVKAGAADGDFLLYVDGNLLVQKPLRFFCFTGAAFRTEVDDAGRAIKATKNMHDRSMDETFVCVVGVIVGNQVIPAKAEFRGTKSKPGEVALRTLNQATSPDWMSLGEAYKVSAAFPHPSGRFVVTCGLEDRMSKSSGRPYKLAVASANPSTVDEMKLLEAAFADERFVSAMNTVADTINSRIAELNKLCG